MLIVSIVGARPQLVKLAPMSEALNERGIKHVVLHTGQHYDASMSDVFFNDLAIPEPDINLGIGSGSHGAQTAAMLTAIEAELSALRPDWALVYGDTNSTLAGALAAAKLGVPLAHVEAGLRSFNRAMPEEINRVVTDHISDLLLAPTVTAARHLTAEGLGKRTRVTGDVMADVCLRVAASVTRSPLLPMGVKPGEFVIATIHRPSNTDTRDRLRDVLSYLEMIPSRVVLAAHPRLMAKLTEHGLNPEEFSIDVVRPFTYPEMVAGLMSAAAIVTDSGGLQKEAFLLGTPCTTLRTETEWVETVEAGWNRLDPDLSQPANVVRRLDEAARENVYGNGAAARQIAGILEAECGGDLN